MSPYAEDKKQPWGAMVVVIAVVIFAAIICVSVVIPNLDLCPPLCWSTPTVVVVTSTPAVGPGTPSPTPPPNSTPGIVVVDFYSALTKQDWISDVAESFNAMRVKTALGNTIVVTGDFGVTSGGSKDAILAGKIQPVAWSPGDQSWVDTANQTWIDLTGHPLVSGACPSTVYAPIGFAMWRKMAEAMGWPNTPISWDDIAALAADPQGWGRYSQPAWGQFKFGHPNPVYSNFGMLMMAEVAYSTLDTTGGLTPGLIQSQPVENAAREIEVHTYHYGIQSRALLDLMTKKGPSYLHAVFTAEAEVLKANQDHAADLARLGDTLVFVFPAKGTYWTEQPYCILDGAEWVDQEEREAAQIFLNYLLEQPQQALAIDKYLRPVDTTIPLHAPIALDNGTNPDVTMQTVPPLESPSNKAQAALIDLFNKVKKKLTVILVLDRSASMAGDKLQSAKAAVIDFLGKLNKADWVSVVAFGDSPIELQPSGIVSSSVEKLKQSVDGLYPEGNTALYDAVCQAIDRANELQIQDEAVGDPRLYGIVVLSDGEDTASIHTENDLMNICLPTGESVEGIKVFTIAYGDDADKDLLLRIANRTNGKFYEAAPNTIQKVLDDIIAQ